MKYFLYRLKWYLAKYFNFNSPVHLDIELSTLCNLNCKFCFRQDYKYSAQNMSLAMFRTIVKQAIEMNIKSIKFNWRGESLMHFLYIYCFSVAKLMGFYTMLNTSLAMDLTNQQLINIAKHIDNLKISFDSSSHKIYNEIRKGADFFKTLSNLDKLIELRKNYNMPKVILNRRTSKLTESDEAFKDFFKDEVDYDIRPTMLRNEKWIFNTPRVQFKKLERKYCGQPSRRMVIDVDGNVWMCCVAYTGEKKLLLGNVKEKSLKELWDSFKRWWLVKELKHGVFNNYTCENCTSGDAYK